MTAQPEHGAANRDRRERWSGGPLRRALILAGWALAVFVVWLGVPFVVAYAVGDIGDPTQARRGEVAGHVLRIAGILFALGVPVLLAWFRLLLSSGLRQTAAVLATLVSLGYALTAIVPGGTELPAPPEPSVIGPAVLPPEREPALGALRDAAFGFLSVVVSWAFAFALASILLRAEPVTAERAPLEEGQVSEAPPTQA